MAKKEAKTDLWVYDLLKQANITLDPQGSSIKEINDALKTASKKGTGKIGFPEYVGVVKDYLIVIENKASLSNHLKLDDGGRISAEVSAITDYAVNGALFYGKHLAVKTNFKKIISFGISGSEKRHIISPIYIDETELYRELPQVESFISFNSDNIDEYYVKEVLKEDTDQEKEDAEILCDAATLHEDLRNYGNLTDTDKPLVVSGILLALRESEFNNFSDDDLSGDMVKTDGKKLYDAIKDNLQRSSVAPEVKRDKLLSQFALIKDTLKLNEVESKLGKTPLKHFAEFLDKKLYKTIRYNKSAEDYIGRFYDEFMSYSGGDGQTLGIVLTPKHITQLFCDLVALQPSDVVMDPCCGTAGFLIAALYKMLNSTSDAEMKRNIKKKQLHGIELQPYMFTIATTNMILRGDGKSNLLNEDFLRQESGKLQLIQSTVGMMNPPYSQGSKNNPDLFEISYTEHLLDSLVEGARCAVIVPQSSMTGKTKEEQAIRENIIKHHTLEGVITLSKDTFYGVGVMPCIAVFTAWIPHPKTKECKFINFEDDGYKIAPHIGLAETETAKDKKQHLLDVWFDRINAENKFCVKTAIDKGDEWLHSFYYFNDEIPIEQEFNKVIGDYLSFEFSMIMQGRKQLFDKNICFDELSNKGAPTLSDRQWGEFYVGDIFVLEKGKTKWQVPTGSYVHKKDLRDGETPRISVTSQNNGISDFYESSYANHRTFENFISVSFLGTVFYHPYEASLDMKVHCLQLKGRSLNEYLGKFLVTEIKKSMENASYGNQISSTDLPNKKIMLPCMLDGEPDFNFMETYVKKLELCKRQEYMRYSQNET